MSAAESGSTPTLSVELLMPSDTARPGPEWALQAEEVLKKSGQTGEDRLITGLPQARLESKVCRCVPAIVHASRCGNGQQLPSLQVPVKRLPFDPGNQVGVGGRPARRTVDYPHPWAAQCVVQIALQYAVSRAAAS